MSRDKQLLIFGLVIALAVVGCAKKINNDAGKAGSGFDDLSSTDDLAQLPQAPASDKQASVVEPLPVDTAPVTQSLPQAGESASAVLNVAATDGVPLASGSQKTTRDQKIQEALKTAGLYHGSIDGKIGPATKKAIEEFQKAHGLKADGKVGPKTWAALEGVAAGQSQAQEAPVDAGQPASSPSALH